MGNEEQNTQAQSAPKKKGHKALIAVAAVIVAAAGGYAVLCGVASSGDTFRKGTAVDGVSIEDMTREAALELLNGQFSGKDEADGVSYASIELQSGIEGVTQTYTLNVSNALKWDFEPVLDQIWEQQRGGSFLEQGYHLIRGGEAVTASPYVEDGTALDEDLAACGILELDTSVQASYETEGDSLLITKGSDGYKVDADALRSTILSNTAEGNYEMITCTPVAVQGSFMDAQQIYDEVYSVAADATLDVAEDRSYTIVESSVGMDFDVDAAQKALDEAEDGSQVSVPLTVEEPKIDTDTLTECLFRDVLGEYTTSVGGSSARRSNVKLAGSKCDGYILLPGEEFDYNATVGQRTAEAGFQAAPAYSNGETVQELGGGVCQVSSTLYCACLYANLKITSRRNHTYVSSYVPKGMDATVSWGGPEYKFVNDTDYPIKLVCTYESGELTFQILGTDVNHYTVKITSETLATISPTVKKVEDSSLAAGSSYTASTGHTGYQVQTYREIYDENGNLLSKEKEAYSYYSPSDTVVHVGTRKAAETKTESVASDSTDTTSGETSENSQSTGTGTATE